MSKAAHRATKMRTEKQPLAMAIESVTLTRGISVAFWGQNVTTVENGERRIGGGRYKLFKEFALKEAEK